MQGSDLPEAKTPLLCSREAREEGREQQSLQVQLSRVFGLLLGNICPSNAMFLLALLAFVTSLSCQLISVYYFSHELLLNFVSIIITIIISYP